MRSALICLFFTIAIQRGSLADTEFRPTPIPLNEWNYDRREVRVGTLHETTPTVATNPAHYWEDALRHSVYLTLVRDKIDQLIAKGEVISPNTKPDQYMSKEVDDHDLWEKVKTAPFDRIEEDEPAAIGDVTIMAKGRLMEHKNGYRFTEDERTKEKCSDEKCMEGVKAIWSVKRVRQRDVETSPGKYHYELTFSVISQPPKKQRKPYENPIRTFTVRETTPERVLDAPQEHRTYVETPIITQRPQRALWVHKNIVPMQRHQGRQYSNGLERIFSSFFSDDDDEYVAPHRYRQPPPHMPPPHMPPPGYTQYSKAYVGAPSDHQKRLTPYPYKPTTYKYARPGLMPAYAHPPHHYIEKEPFGMNPYGPDHRYIGPNKALKTTRPPVLPTPLPPTNSTEDNNATVTTESIITKAPEIITYHKTYGKPKPIKINYLSDHVRPPVYNAPPGVFVTLDKKPFKPMPPLKLVHSKPMKSYKPTDFRPSPQVLDMHQFSDPNPLKPDTAFRPILPWKIDNSTTEKIEVAESITQVNNTKKVSKKPPKKHENIKFHRSTTEAPEIITAGIPSEDDSMDWANIVGAFTKTTPMESQTLKGKPEVSESTTTSTTTTTVASTTAKRKTTTTTEAVEETSTTTQKPKKRTRPPPKFAKTSEKVKKHKRVTTTKAPHAKNTQDLTPQASSAAASQPAWNTTVKATTTTSSTTTTSKPSTTTTTKQTTTVQPTTSAEPKSVFTTTRSKIKNRFRQSTLLYKGTSVNHDRWSATTVHPTLKTRTITPAEGTFPPRRKGSNFQGYTSTTQKLIDKDYHKDDHEDYYPSSTEPISKSISDDDTVDQYESNSDTDYQIVQEDGEDDEDENDEQESKDHTEYIFQPSSSNDKTNEISEQEDAITTETVITAAFNAPKNKTKCKKKKNATTTEDVPKESYETSSMTPTTEVPVTPSIFDELFGAFESLDDNKKNDNSSTSKPEIEEQESQNHGKFAKIDDDLQEFLDSLNKSDQERSNDGEYEDGDDGDIDVDGSSYASEDDGPSPRDTSDDFEEYHDRPYSLLELMAME